MECNLGGLTFSSKFDSGNLASVELVTDSTSSSRDVPSNEGAQEIPIETTCNNSSSGNVGLYGMKVDYDYKVWTRPDCAGTKFENGNRTWFYFSVHGYKSGEILRITIMNMNKQSKIYSQGYSPFYRVCQYPDQLSKWHRVQEKPAWNSTDGQFCLTFVHHFLDPYGAYTYFAFCFPWSYKEIQEQLTRIQNIFDTSSPATLPVTHLDVATQQHCSLSGDKLATNQLKKQIYFCRELLCYSLEGRRIDLLTISDWSNCTNEREECFDPLLFPDRSTPRPWKFKKKKVVFISARVHPGETPSSHVFNGLLEFLLRPTDARVRELRCQYVFKLIPMLNPDGVARGHYRTDSRGVNLNRVYLSPDFLYYPSIYATKALLVYHHTHYGKNLPYAGFLGKLWKEFRCFRARDEMLGTTLQSRSTVGSPELMQETATLDDAINSIGQNADLLENRATSKQEPVSPVLLEIPIKLTEQTSSTDSISVISPDLLSLVCPSEFNVAADKSTHPVILESHPVSPLLVIKSSKEETFTNNVKDLTMVDRTENFTDAMKSVDPSCVSAPTSSANMFTKMLCPHSSLSVVNEQVCATTTSVSQSCKSNKLLAAFKGRKCANFKAKYLPFLSVKSHSCPSGCGATRESIESKLFKRRRPTMNSTPPPEQDFRHRRLNSSPDLGDPTLPLSEVIQSDEGYSRASPTCTDHVPHSQLSIDGTLTNATELSVSMIKSSVVNRKLPTSGTSECSPGNEGSDEDDNAQESGDCKQVEDNDLSINSQYSELLDRLKIFITEKMKRKAANDTASDAMLIQLDRLRRAEHLADPSLRRLKHTSKLFMYMDLHGHCSKRGCFLYGNSLESEEQMIENVIFALLIGVNSPSFDFNGCNFTVRNMYQRDKRGVMTKEGSGRVAVWKHLGISLCYTIECNYNTAAPLSRIARHLLSSANDEAACFTPPGTSIEPHWTDFVDPTKKEYLSNASSARSNNNAAGRSNNSPNRLYPLLSSPNHFTPLHFQELGRAVLVSILDLNQSNPSPRLINLAGNRNSTRGTTFSFASGLSEYNNMKCLRDWVHKFVRNLAASGGNIPSNQSQTSVKHISDARKYRSTLAILSSNRSRQYFHSRSFASSSPVSSPLPNTSLPSLTFTEKIIPISQELANDSSMNPVQSSNSLLIQSPSFKCTSPEHILFGMRKSKTSANVVLDCAMLSLESKHQKLRNQSATVKSSDGANVSSSMKDTKKPNSNPHFNATSGGTNTSNKNIFNSSQSVFDLLDRQTLPFKNSVKSTRDSVPMVRHRNPMALKRQSAIHLNRTDQSESLASTLSNWNMSVCNRSSKLPSNNSQTSRCERASVASPNRKTTQSELPQLDLLNMRTKLADTCINPTLQSKLRTSCISSPPVAHCQSQASKQLFPTDVLKNKIPTRESNSADLNSSFGVYTEKWLRHSGLTPSKVRPTFLDQVCYSRADVSRASNLSTSTSQLPKKSLHSKYMSSQKAFLKPKNSDK